MFDSWCHIATVKSKDDTFFPKITRLVSAFVIIPISNDTVERLFSVMSVIKTKLWNKLAIQMHCNSGQHSQSLIQPKMAQQDMSPWQFFLRCLLDSTCPFTITSAINLEHQGQQGSRRMKKLEVSSLPMCCSWVIPFCSLTDLAENWCKNLRVRCCWCWW